MYILADIVTSYPSQLFELETKVRIEVKWHFDNDKF